jgi:hypothetical protein
VYCPCCRARMKLSCIGQGYAACASAKLVGVRFGWCKYKARQRSAGLSLQAASAFGLARSQRLVVPCGLASLAKSAPSSLPASSDIGLNRTSRRIAVLGGPWCVPRMCVCGVGASPQTRRPAQVPRACVRSTSAVLSETPASSSQVTRTPQRCPSALESSHVRIRPRSACSFPDLPTPLSGRSPPSVQTCADMPCRRRAGFPGRGEST